MSARPDNPQPESWSELALHAGGRSLIEASAGTGKTWTISLLYLRLLLEQDLGPAQIVVTTFTDAAAQELRERIRARVLWAEQQAHTPTQDDREAARWLHARWQRDGGRDSAAIAADVSRLRLAQGELDRAPIGTLHSLCRRILADHPFESGSTFDIGAPALPDAINDELAEDLWRRLGQSVDALDDGDRIWWNGGRESLEKHVRAVLAPGVGVEVLAVPPMNHLMQSKNAAILRAWCDAAAQFKRPKDSRLRTTLLALALFIEKGDCAAPPPEHLQEVFENPLDKYLKAPAVGPAAQSEAIAIGRAAAAILPAFCDALRSNALARYRTQLRERRRQRFVDSGAMTFDELIERVHEALTGGSDALARSLAQAWPVALVDEFQDTDPQQYAILDRIYRSSEGMRGRLVMIGDPKQAIYRFRGGDVDTYLQARAQATSTLGLRVNFRSSRQLVRAINAFYAHAGDRLSSELAHPIVYVPVTDSGKRDAEPYLVDGMICERPLQFHYWDAADAPDDADGRVAAALTACADQIVDLLSGRHAIGARAVEPGDIAVLLPTGRQIKLLREQLRERGVPSVSTAWISVFESDWARELQIVLFAALHPRDDGAVRAALATRLYARTYDELRELRQQPDTWQREAEAFESLDQLWRAQGVLAVVQRLAAGAGARLFAADEGERALTDLRHLGELLQARSEQITGREELLTWLAAERSKAAQESGDAAADERQMRIESDAARVRLMTLHASKGLEFSIVLLPLMWTNRQNTKDSIAIVHDADSGQRLVAFGDAAKERYRRDGQDERFRLLYVALTRARYACHVYALSPNRPMKRNSTVSDSDPERAPLDAMIERLLRNPEPPQSMAHVAWRVGPWSWPRADYRPAQAEAREERHVLAEPPAPRFESTWSFSSLARGAPTAALEDEPASDEGAGHVAGLPEVDAGFAFAQAVEAVVETRADGGEAEHPGLAWLAPIAGADFGNAVHAIFERRAIGVPMSRQHSLIERCLLGAGVSLRGVDLRQFVPQLAARVEATLDAPLLPDSAPALTLGTLPAHALCTELPFEFALGEVSLKRLREVCDFVPPTPLRTLRGLMSGSIDLVIEHAGTFHVLDYKSNRLGTRLRDYAPEQLERAMADDHYRFQALLYTVAVDRYLRQRLPGYRRATQLGAAIYLFVRAVGIAAEVAPQAGIWSQRFDDALIDAVDAVLAGERAR